MENFNTDDVEVLIGGRARPGARGGLRGHKTVTRLGHRHIHRAPRLTDGFVESHRSLSGADDRNPELPGATVHDFAEAAGTAIDAGFDGVEVHRANGYLVHQFLSAATNLRSDKWGGSIPNRIRFAVEVVRAVADTIGTHCTALRISPGNPFNDMAEPDAVATYFALIEQLRRLGLAYRHVVEVGEP